MRQAEESDVKSFSGKTAVVTGGGTGMGRELALQLATEGCNVAICDVSAENMAETQRLCENAAPEGTRFSTFVADVSVEDQVVAFVDAVKRDLQLDHVHLLFNNAGIAGSGSIVDGDRAQWEKTFNVNWFGVYFSTRAFLPMLMKADESRIVNTSSINGVWASIGPGRPYSAYCTSKFAVKGFTEALITDLAANAPHVKCSVVMPGRIGTDIVTNSGNLLISLGGPSDLSALRDALGKFTGKDLSHYSDDQVRTFAKEMAQTWKDESPTTAAQAATIILDGVKAGNWRILVGADAEALDERVRATPEAAYTHEFHEALIRETTWNV